jgi:hypothetical protein
MLDKLEQHIRDHREELDVLEPDYDRLWKGIEGKLEGGESRATKPGTNHSTQVKPLRTSRKRYLVKSKKKQSLWHQPALRWAASIVIAIGVGLGGSHFMAPAVMTTASAEEAPAVTAPAQVNGLPAEFANMESYYQEAIRQHTSQMVVYHEEGISLDGDFSIDLDQLQQDYGALQQELQLSENPEAVIDAMVQNLTMQLEIVQQQLRILESIKKAQQNTNDAVQI